MNRFLSLTAAGFALLIAGAQASHSQSPITIKFSHVVANDTPKGQGALKFKELVERALPGRVVVEIFPNSQLYKDKEEIEALQLGAVQMLAPSVAKFGPLGVREFEVFGLPFILKDEDGFKAVANGDVGKSLFKKLEAKGIKGLAFWDIGFEMMSANKPLRVPDDFHGLKMRIQSSKVLDAQMRALGAIPQVMAFSELYQGLQTGIIDGTESVPSNFYTQKLGEVQKYYTISNHNHLAYAVVVNKPFWDGLPQDVRDVLTSSLKEATDHVNNSSKKENDEALDKIKASGRTSIIELTSEERNLWIKATMPVYGEMSKRIGQETIDAVIKATGFVAPK